MIKIRKDNDIKVVTQGAYKEFYEYLGYEIIKDKPLKKEVEIKETKQPDIKEDKQEEVKEEIKEEKKEIKGKQENYSRK